MRLPSRDPWKQAVRAARAAYGPDFDQDHPRTIVRPRIILTDDEIQRLHEEALMQDWYERARRRRQVTA